MITEYNFMTLKLDEERTKMFQEWLDEQNNIAIDSGKGFDPAHNPKPYPNKPEEWSKRSWHSTFTMKYTPSTVGDYIQFTHLYTGDILDLTLIGDEMF